MYLQQEGEEVDENTAFLPVFVAIMQLQKVQQRYKLLKDILIAG